MNKRQAVADFHAVAFTAIIFEPVKLVVGDYSTKEEAERALAGAAVTLGNVKGDIFPRMTV